MNLEEIQTGAYGTVFKIIHENKPIALKRNNIDYRVDGVQCIREWDVCAHLRHPHIVPFEGSFYKYPEDEEPPEKYKADPMYLMYSLQDFDIHNYLFDHTKINGTKEANARKIFCHILLALEYIHGNGFIYRDIKAPNILWNRQEEKAYLCDMGFTRFVSYPMTPSSFDDVYCPPEAVQGNKYTQSADMWIVGAIFYELLHKKILIKRHQDIDKIPSIINKVEGGAGEILQGLLQVNPRKRLTATQVLDHAYFEGYRDYIRETREKYPPNSLPETPLKLAPYSVRNQPQFREELEMSIQEASENSEVITFRVLFQAISLFHRFYKDHDSVLLFRTCLYICIKYFASIVSPPSYKYVLYETDQLSGEEKTQYIKKATDAMCALELEIISSIGSIINNGNEVGIMLFQKTPFEYAYENGLKLTDKEYAEMARNYAYIPNLDGYSNKDLLKLCI